MSVSSGVRGNVNVTDGSLTALTEVVDSGQYGQPGGLCMPSVKLTVKFTFSGGEEFVSSAESPAIHAKGTADARAPYSIRQTSTPEQPILVSSSNFIEIA